MTKYGAGPGAPSAEQRVPHVSVTDIAEATGMSVVVGHPEQTVSPRARDDPIGAVAVLPHEPAARSAAVRAWRAYEGPGLMVVYEWRPVRVDGPLPPLIGELRPVFGLVGAVAVTVAGTGRRVNPPADVVAVAKESGCPLLWADADCRTAVIVQRVESLLRRPAAETIGPSLDTALSELIRHGTELEALIAGAAGRIGAHITVSAGTDVLAEEPVGSGDSARVVAALHLERHGRVVAELTVRRETPLSSREQEYVEDVARVAALASYVRLSEAATREPTEELLREILGEDLTARERALRRAKRPQIFPQRRAVILVLEPFGVPVSRTGTDLQALKASHGNITVAARRLFLHPNTLRLRIARIETLIGPFLADPDRRQTVFVSLDLFLLDQPENE
ncbi:PucR family transcriptional regulator [Streptomyces sp. NRRL S-646]|uniref:PucR family transcriptional regulator n=1 Tax=Streptomyces sp. NRRL S-646 TaxID=1463917 RepID=UPI0004C75405|nr:PucR family transcriptional regulator [Streptomyces sp. NRRL S-646]